MIHYKNALQLADALTGLPVFPGDRDITIHAAEMLCSQNARIAELEAKLYAIGAGGVGQSIKPQVQADTAREPVAWRVRPFDYGIGYEGVDALTTRKEQCEIWARKGWKVEPLYTTPQPTENLHCKSTQKRLATLWGHVKQEPDHFRDATQMVPARQPLTAETYTALAQRIATKYTHRSDPAFCGYAFLPHTLEQFVRAIEQAHGITGD